MSTPLNVRVSADGTRGRPVCEFCGRSTRALFPILDDRLSALWWLPGWSVAPYPADFVHQDGSSGSTWTCPRCNARLRRGEGLWIKADRR